MPFPIIPDKFKSLWNVWDLRVAVILSLFCQILLISIASLRKRTGNVFLTMFVWSAYLLADWIATYALGLIASGMASDYSKPALNEDLITFWASFLLVHLGGPHNITAFALEDNELWLRHLLQLIVHLITIAYVFTQSIPNELWIPTALIYLAGFIKYAERTRSLYLASLGALNSSNLPRPTAGSNYAQLMQTYKSRLINSIPMDIIISAEAPEVEPPDCPVANPEESPLEEFQVLQKDAFKILEVELNFMYDLLYTKMAVVHGKRGFIFRFVCLVSIVIALGCFVSHHKHHKNEIHEFDIFVTYILLVGALVLDICAIFKLIFSDWTIAKHKNSKESKLPHVIFKIRENLSFDKNHRWSKSLAQHSLITYCIGKRFRRINLAIDCVFGIFGAKDFMNEIRYKKSEPINRGKARMGEVRKLPGKVGRLTLEASIFTELREKARKANTSKDAKEICSCRGERVILEATRFFTTLDDSVRVEYDESILRWHVATELCYYTPSDKDDKDDEDGNRRYCKILSQYMMYLLVMRPAMMSTVLGIVQVRSAKIGNNRKMEDYEPSVGGIGVLCCKPLQSTCPRPAAQQRWRVYHFCLVTDDPFRPGRTFPSRFS
ncbi:hypothetical protein L1049_000147 [Liquidambar formosana]|uniref:DUF4220 domain-containing protein n=1 Tax=Liquidambar formosana TaxID=63359 RepID=A0AAP0N8A1_LIQFO